MREVVGSPAAAGNRKASEQDPRKVVAAHGAAVGSAQARALALRMFGCLADLAKDNVNVRSLILSGLRSSDSLSRVTAASYPR